MALYGIPGSGAEMVANTQARKVLSMWAVTAEDELLPTPNVRRGNGENSMIESLLLD